MRFAVVTAGGTARCGILHLGGDGRALQTPCLLLQTRRGLPAFVTPELLADLHCDAQALTINPTHFLDGPPASTISEIGGAHKLTGTPDHVFVALTRDSLTSEPDGEGTTKLGAAFETFAGRRVVASGKYMELVNALKPNLWTTLPDEVPAWVSTKRNKLSVDRTLQWMDQCLGLQAAGENASFGTIVGGGDIQERKRSASETAKRHVAGFYLGGFGLGESPGDRPALLRTVIDCLPKGHPRLISGLGMPQEVLEAVSAGVDIISSTYPHVLTRGGYAMTFPLSKDERRPEIPLEDCADLGSDFTKINLRSAAYKNDVMPILAGCNCYTCLKHSRAYINHLLNTHEMVAETLLDMHNIHHYLKFFRAIREAISGSYFDEFKNWFICQRHCIQSKSKQLPSL